MRNAFLTLGLAALLPLPLLGSGPTISGEYLEARTADVYTGPCFANGEASLAGKEAILAWHVRRGSFQGVSLRDLSVVAAVRAQATLGDPYERALPAASVIVVDERARPAQQRALLALAHSLGGALLNHVRWVRRAPIRLELNPSSQTARLRAGKMVALSTRALEERDLVCGNEIVYYTPLTPLESYHPAYTQVHRFQAIGLGTVWSSPSKRSAFVGTFVR